MPSTAEGGGSLGQGLGTGTPAVDGGPQEGCGPLKDGEGPADSGELGAAGPSSGRGRDHGAHASVQLVPRGPRGPALRPMRGATVSHQPRPRGAPTTPGDRWRVHTGCPKWGLHPGTERPPSSGPHPGWLGGAPRHSVCERPGGLGGTSRCPRGCVGWGHQDGTSAATREHPGRWGGEACAQERDAERGG